MSDHTDIQSFENALPCLRANKYSRYPFDPTSLPFDVSSSTYVEISKGSNVYDILLTHLASKSIEIDGLSKAKSFSNMTFSSPDDEDDDLSSCCKKDIKNTVGLGLFAFSDLQGEVMYALHQTIGDPIGSNCGIDFYHNLVVFTQKDVSVISNFLKYLIEQAEATSGLSYKIFKWHSRHEYWRMSGDCLARTMDSVILPEAVKSKILNDISRFLLPETKTFYFRHGIPYRRSFLFYGAPGAGKSSLIQAIAGHFKRSISFLQLTDKDMSDTSLLTAIQQLKKGTIVVLEDIDSCFSKDRNNKIQHSKVTFSGLLNALDGVGSSHGQIFILTTNLRDQLDPALIRCGRVDVQIEFTHAVEEQIIKMWGAFYPEATHLAADFTAAITKKLGEAKINTASLHHIFVLNMHSTPEEAIASVDKIIDDLDFLNKVTAEEAAERAKEAEEVKKTENKEEEE